MKTFNDNTADKHRRDPLPKVDAAYNRLVSRSQELFAILESCGDEHHLEEVAATMQAANLQFNKDADYALNFARSIHHFQRLYGEAVDRYLVQLELAVVLASACYLAVSWNAGRDAIGIRLPILGHCADGAI